VPELRIIDDELWQKVKARQMAVRTEMRLRPPNCSVIWR
jgi:hypothetical protein